MGVAAAKASALVYVSNGSTSVFVYTYPQLKLTQTLKGFEQPLGECVDKSGNVWVANFGAQELDKYAHGGTKRIATLKMDAYHTPYGCAVDLATGDLAVTTWRGGNGPGYVSVFKGAKGKPTTYSDTKFVYALSLGYDNKSDLFVAGVGSGSAFQYAELAKGKKTLTPVKIKQSIGYPGDVQFDGKYVTVGDEVSRTIYRISGLKAVGATTLAGTGTLAGSYIYGNSILGVDDSGLGVYAYPAGGSPTASVGISGSASVVVSAK